MKSIFNLAVIALLALTCATDISRAQMAPNTVLENAVETTTDQVIFPSTLSGRVQVRACVGCLHSTLQLDAKTRFVLAGQDVSLKEMAAYAGATRGRPLDIHYRLSDSVVSLVSVLTK